MDNIIYRNPAAGDAKKIVDFIKLWGGAKFFKVWKG